MNPYQVLEELLASDVRPTAKKVLEVTSEIEGRAKKALKAGVVHSYTCSQASMKSMYPRWWLREQLREYLPPTLQLLHMYF